MATTTLSRYAPTLADDDEGTGEEKNEKEIEDRQEERCKGVEVDDGSRCSSFPLFLLLARLAIAVMLASVGLCYAMETIRYDHVASLLYTTHTHTQTQCKMRSIANTLGMIRS